MRAGVRWGWGWGVGRVWEGLRDLVNDLLVDFRDVFDFIIDIEVRYKLYIIIREIGEDERRTIGDEKVGRVISIYI